MTEFKMGDYVTAYDSTGIFSGVVTNHKPEGWMTDMIKIHCDNIGSKYFFKNQCELKKQPRFFWIRESSMMTEVMSDEPADLTGWIKVSEVI